MINIPKTKKNFIADAINHFYSVYVYESVNLDDGDSALVGSPFLFSLIPMRDVILSKGLLQRAQSKDLFI
ncbi:hypothetical protein HDC90_000615 [Pedobacter sp. AK013]|nr:hypothetical protein [Pedobacter sp. AK013]